MYGVCLKFVAHATRTARNHQPLRSPGDNDARTEHDSCRRTERRRDTDTSEDCD